MSCKAVLFICHDWASIYYQLNYCCASFLPHCGTNKRFLLLLSTARLWLKMKHKQKMYFLAANGFMSCFHHDWEYL